MRPMDKGFNVISRARGNEPSRIMVKSAPIVSEKGGKAGLIG
jgi:hypothetical protein